MSYNNFSDWFKKALINAENNIKNLWLKQLNIEDIFVEIIKNSTWWIKEIFDLYWINEKLAIEIINKWLFNELPNKRRWVYSWMSSRLKNVILWSVKIAASFSKTKASLEDFLLSILKNDAWFASFLDYIGIIPSDLESNIVNLNKIWAIDWIKWANNKNVNKNINPEAIDELLWNISQNLFSWNLQW